jgi:hypothetical protein
MIIFPKKDIVPIIIPQICFLDKYNDVNNYVEMNPSLIIDENGYFSILVRCVNYKKFNTKNFTLYGAMSNSIYYKITGKINTDEKLDLENCEYNILNSNYNLPVYPAYWKGMEDIRFINKNELLVNIPELHPGGKPTILKADLINNEITNFVSCEPNTIDEKNWMPYNDNRVNKVIYSLNPFIIKSIEKDDKEIIEINESIKEKLNGFHGSSNGIELNKYERLFLVHLNKEVITHRWLIFNIKTQSILVSEEFVFFKNSYIEFTCSLSKFEDRIFVSMGINDDKAYIIEVTNKDIFNTFLIMQKTKSDYPTIVTMLYDIRSMETQQFDRNRKLNSFIDFSKKFLLQLPFPIIFFIDENEETYDAIYNTRKEFNLLDNTYIYMCDFKTTYFYKYLSKLQELQKKFFIRNGEIEHETPLYVILNNNKFDCIDKAVDLNPFGSSHFIWMDFGINHVSLNNEYIYEWINQVPDKIKQLCINPYIEKIPPKIYFEYIYHNTAGGLFSGSIENMKKYSELFKKKTEEIYNDNWYQIDEAVMTIVQKENPELFDLFYGDYQGIVSNYLYPLHNIDLILHGSQKCIDSNNTERAYKILSYCSPYFEKNMGHQSIFWFIHQHLIVDYYHNNVLIVEPVIKMIQYLTGTNYDRILQTLINNKHNINLYKNKELFINKFAELELS